MAGLTAKRLPSFRVTRDVLSELSDAELITRYHMNREGIMFVTDLVRDTISTSTTRNKAITPEMKVIATLSYLTTGEQCNSDDLGLSQQTMSSIIKETVYALTSLDILRRFIQFPTTQEATATKQREFLALYGMKGIIGVIDGTHVRLAPPEEFTKEYVNRKGQHTINVQVVLDQNYKFLDIVAQWPGSVRDARILRQSGLFALFEAGRVPAGCHLLGDRGYPNKRWLLTPYLRPQPGPQTNYNM